MTQINNYIVEGNITKDATIIEKGN
jgi:hypothetical protein